MKYFWPLAVCFLVGCKKTSAISPEKQGNGANQGATAGAGGGAGMGGAPAAGSPGSGGQAGDQGNTCTSDQIACSTGCVSYDVGCDPGPFSLAQVKITDSPNPDHSVLSQLLVGDLDRDGYPDLISLVYYFAGDKEPDNASGIRVRRGDGKGDFLEDKPLIDTGGNPSQAILSDMDGDGLLDLVVAQVAPTGSPPGHGLVFLKGKGDATFEPPLFLIDATDAHSLAMLDVDGDGTKDIVIGSFEADKIVAVPRKASGTFGQPFVLINATRPVEFVATDFDGDGLDDLLFANYHDPATSPASHNGVQVLRSSGSGKPALWPALALASNGDWVPSSAGKTGSRGGPSLVVADGFTPTLLVHANPAMDGLVAESLGFVSRTAILGDLDGDGFADLVRVGANEQKTGAALKVALSRHNSHFTQVADIDLSSRSVYPHDLLIADFDGDGKNDVIYYSNNSPGFAFVKNTTP